MAVQLYVQGVLQTVICFVLLSFEHVVVDMLLRVASDSVVFFSPQANYTDRAIAAGQRS
jgi:formate/nitrite transporter FocA (FNT family)